LAFVGNDVLPATLVQSESVGSRRSWFMRIQCQSFCRLCTIWVLVRAWAMHLRQLPWMVKWQCVGASLCLL
jgi:hypothetical protein